MAKTWDGAHHQNANRTDKECCARCGKEIKGKGHWLELNSANGSYRDETMPTFPDSESQGWFEFGDDCAKRTLDEQAAGKR